VRIPGAGIERRESRIEPGGNGLILCCEGEALLLSLAARPVRLDGPESEESGNPIHACSLSGDPRLLRISAETETENSPALGNKHDADMYKTVFTVCYPMVLLVIRSLSWFSDLSSLRTAVQL
jgi:hypothetical protein